MKVNLEISDLWKGLVEPEKVEKKYNVKFVCETPIKYRNGWRDQSSLIFYGEKHPEGSNYMALSMKFDIAGKFHSLVISDGISATEDDITGILDGDEVIYSRYRHDYRVGKTGVMIDGGRDYFRSSNGKVIILRIVEGNLEVV
jgi:hypothetical protein